MKLTAVMFAAMLALGVSSVAFAQSATPAGQANSDDKCISPEQKRQYANDGVQDANDDRPVCPVLVPRANNRAVLVGAVGLAVAAAAAGGGGGGKKPTKPSSP